MTERFQPRILVVDDFPTMRRILCALLKDLGFERTEAAENGLIALGMLRKTRFDFVISDTLMPDMGGFELLHALKEDPSLDPPPVMIVVAEDHAEDIGRARAGGAVGCLTRPFTRATLEARLREAMPALFPA